MRKEAQGIDELVGFATDLVRRSGSEALRFYGRGQPRMKFDQGLVTEAELRLSEFMAGEIQRNFPHHQLFQNNHDDAEYTHEERRHLWVFDPLDGVANFQAGIPVWGVSLALIENFWPVLGLFYMPATDDLFQARAGSGARWGELEIGASAQDSLDDESLLLIYSRFHQDYRTHFPGKIRNLGSTAAHVCYVATGRAEAAVIAHETFPSLAAVRVILEAAGGKLYRLDGSEFFLNAHLGGERIEEPLLAASPGIGEQVLRFLKAEAA